MHARTQTHMHAHARGKLDNSVHTAWHVTYFLGGVKVQSPAVSAWSAVSAWPSPSCMHNSLALSVLTYFSIPYSKDHLLGRSWCPRSCSLNSKTQSEQRRLLHFRTRVLPPPAFPVPISSSFHSFLRKWKSWNILGDFATDDYIRTCRLCLKRYLLLTTVRWYHKGVNCNTVVKDFPNLAVFRSMHRTF